WSSDVCSSDLAVISPLFPKEDFPDLNNITFSLTKNGKTEQTRNTKDMIFNIESLIVFISKYITLREGDLIYTGTPVGVGPIAIGDKFEGFIQNNPVFICHIK